MNGRLSCLTKSKITIIFFAMTAFFSFGAMKMTAYAANGSTTVYTTNTGKCYHNDGCSSLSKSKNATTLEKAVAKGLTPCSKCKPPALDNASSDNKSSNDSINKNIEKKAATNSSDTLVWQSASGSCYHSKNNCGKMNPNKAKQITESEAKAKGLTKCSKCW